MFPRPFPRKNLCGSALALTAALLLLSAFPAAGAALPQAGDTVTDVTLPAPQGEDDLAYLGLAADTPEFKLTDIRAKVVLVEVFNAFCPHCQADAPVANQVHGLIAKAGLDDKLKILGIGANNTAFEIDLYRKKYEVVFPLVTDQNMNAAFSLGVSMTPSFLLVGLSGDEPEVLLSWEGRLGEAQEFFDRMVDAAGLDES